MNLVGYIIKNIIINISIIQRDDMRPDLYVKSILVKKANIVRPPKIDQVNTAAIRITSGSQNIQIDATIYVSKNVKVKHNI